MGGIGDFGGGAQRNVPGALCTGPVVGVEFGPTEEAGVFGGEVVEISGELAGVPGVTQQTGDHAQVGSSAGGAGGSAQRVVQVPQCGETGLDCGGDLDADVGAADAAFDGVLDVCGPPDGEVVKDVGRYEGSVGVIGARGFGGQVVEGGQGGLQCERGPDVRSGQGE